MLPDPGGGGALAHLLGGGTEGDGRALTSIIGEQRQVEFLEGGQGADGGRKQNDRLIPVAGKVTQHQEQTLDGAARAGGEVDVQDAGQGSGAGEGSRLTRRSCRRGTGGAEVALKRFQNECQPDGKQQTDDGAQEEIWPVRLGSGPSGRPAGSSTCR